MAVSREIHCNSESKSSQGLVTIDHGIHANIELDPEAKLIRKHFAARKTEGAEELARREFDQLSRFSLALGQIPFVNCPTPVRIDPHDAAVWMTFSAGTRLDLLLAEQSDALMEHLDHIAELVATGLEVYVNEFEAPYYDLSPNNMLYDPLTGELTLIDFTIPDLFHSAEYEREPIEISLGSFVSYSTFYTVQLRTWNRGNYWEAQKQLTIAILRLLSATNELRPDVIRKVASDAFAYTKNIQRARKRLWNSTFGRFLFERRTQQVFACLPKG